MPMVAFAAHILPGREEGWRRFLQEISEIRSREYEGCRRRLGVRDESVWLARTRGGETALAYLETDDPEVHHSVSVWCERFSVNLATAPLS